MILSLSASASAAERDVERRVNELLARMTLAEKIGQLVQINASGGQLPDALKERLRQGRLGSMLNEIVPAASLEIQRIAVEESRLGIPLLMGRDVIHGYRTIFPIPLAQAAAWNPQLVTDCAAVAAEEARRGRLPLDVRADDGHRARPALGPDRRGLRRGPVPRAALARGDGPRLPGRRLRRAEPHRRLREALRGLRRGGGRPRLRHRLDSPRACCATSTCRPSRPRWTPASRR